MLGFVAQWIERLSPEQKVVGSIPIKPTTGVFDDMSEALFHAVNPCLAGMGEEAESVYDEGIGEACEPSAL